MQREGEGARTGFGVRKTDVDFGRRRHEITKENKRIWERMRRIRKRKSYEGTAEREIRFKG